MNPADEQKFREAKTAELTAVIQEFLTKTPVGRRFKNTPERWEFLWSKLSKIGKANVDAAMLEEIAEKWQTFGYDLLVPTKEQAEKAKQREEGKRLQTEAAKAEAARNTPEALAAREQKAREDLIKAEADWVREIEKPVGNENSWQRAIRVAEAKEKRARSKWPRAVPSSQPHPQTLLNTKQEKALVAERAKRQKIARETPPILPTGTGGHTAFLQAEEARKRDEIVAAAQAARDRNK